MFESIESEFGWPCQRIRLGTGLLLFTLFELTIARQLPGMFVLLVFAVGVGCLFSAALTLQEVKLRMQIDAISRAFVGPQRSSLLP